MPGNRGQHGENPKGVRFSFPAWAGLTPYTARNPLMSHGPPPLASPTSNSRFNQATTNVHGLPAAQLRQRLGGFAEASESLGETHSDHEKLTCCGLPLPISMTLVPPDSGRRQKALHTLKLIFFFHFDTLPRWAYANALLHIPSLYKTRVSRILEDAALTMPEVQKLYTPVVPQTFGMEGPSLAIAQFKSSWESFVDSVMREWNTLNVVSVLLLSAIVTVLQVQGAGDDPVTRTAALISLVCAFMSLLFGCLYVVRFGAMKRTHQALTWAEESNKNTSIWWNVWVLLAMPAVWLSWSLILFSVCILSFVWRTGSSTSPPGGGTFNQLSPRGALGVRIAITATFSLGLIYLVFIVKTLRMYGARMDEKWKKKVVDWIAEHLDAPTRPTAETLNLPHTSTFNGGSHTPGRVRMQTAAHYPQHSVVNETNPAPIKPEEVAHQPVIPASPRSPTSGLSSPPTVTIKPIPLPSPRNPLGLINSGSPDSQKGITTTSRALRSEFNTDAQNVADDTGVTSHTRSLDPNVSAHLPEPLAFFRAQNHSLPHNHFDRTRIVELSSLVLGMPDIPPELVDHDVCRDDWVVFLNDLFWMWRGRLPPVAPKLRSSLRERADAAIMLVNIWNDRFFRRRQVEITLVMEKLNRGSMSKSAPCYTLYLTHTDRRFIPNHKLSVGGHRSKQVSHRQRSNSM